MPVLLRSWRCVCHLTVDTVSVIASLLLMQLIDIFELSVCLTCSSVMHLCCDACNCSMLCSWRTTDSHHAMQSKAQGHIQPNSFLRQIRLCSKLRHFLEAHQCQSQTRHGPDDANTKSIHGCCVVSVCLCFPPASAKTCFCKQLTASSQTHDIQSGGFAEPTAEIESLSA